MWSGKNLNEFERNKKTILRHAIDSTVFVKDWCFIDLWAFGGAYLLVTSAILFENQYLSPQHIQLEKNRKKI